MKKTLGLTGVTVNAMALIAPGAFMWLTFQMQAAQVDFNGTTTAMDMFGGLVVALILGFLTASSFSKLSVLYPESGTGSSYYFAGQAMLNEHRFSPFARLAKFIVGHLEAIRKNGLEIKSVFGDFNVRPALATSLRGPRLR